MSHFKDSNNTKTILNWTGTIINEEVTGKCYRSTFQRSQEFALVVVINIITENNITGLRLEDVLDIAYHSARSAEGEFFEGNYRKAYPIVRDAAENMLFFARDVIEKRKQSKKESDLDDKVSD